MKGNLYREGNKVLNSMVSKKPTVYNSDVQNQIEYLRTVEWSVNIMPIDIFFLQKAFYKIIKY